MTNVGIPASNRIWTDATERRTVVFGMGMILFLCMTIPIATAAQKKPKVRKGQYKRVHQHALDLVTSGAADRAMTFLRAYARDHSADAETEFMMAVARAQQGETAAALDHLGTAIRLGLPEERFLAGPRELFAPLQDLEMLVKMRARYAHRAIQGPMLGAVTDRSVHVWLRTATPATVRVETTDERGKKTVGESLSTLASDLTAVVPLDGLRPDTLYRYTVAIDGRADPGSLEQHFRFRTASTRGERCKFSLAFGGGAGFVPEHERMWNTINGRHPRLLLLLGDNVYSDEPTSAHMQRYCYYRRQSRPEFRRLVAHTPVYSIWDDHDFGTNDCWGGPAIEQPSWKRPVWNIFRQNWANPAYGGGAEQPGCWYQFSYGDVDFIMLDGRYYRTDPRSEDLTMLGPVQKEWLKRQLTESKATFKMLCSPVPWCFFTKEDSRDTWNGYREEREDIFSWIEQNRIEGVVLLSADRHRSDAWRIERPGGYDFYEFNSSRLTNQHTHPTKSEALFSYNAKQSFGLVTVDTKCADPLVNFSVVTIDGDTVFSLGVARSQLAFAN